MWGLETCSSRGDTRRKWPMVSPVVAVAHVANSFHLMAVGLVILGRQPSARNVHMVVGLQQLRLLQRPLAWVVQAIASASLHRQWLRHLPLVLHVEARLQLDTSKRVAVEWKLAERGHAGIQLRLRPLHQELLQLCLLRPAAAALPPWRSSHLRRPCKGSRSVLAAGGVESILQEGPFLKVTMCLTRWPSQ